MLISTLLFRIPSFTANEFRKAADLYTQALDSNPFDATLWCNRAYARIKLEEHGYALNDASTCFFWLDAERSRTPMLIASVVIAVSQGDFFGSKICQGTRTRLGAKFLTLMRPRVLYRHTSGASLVTIFPGGLSP